MAQSPSYEAISFLAAQEILAIFRALRFIIVLLRPATLPYPELAESSYTFPFL